MAAAVTQAELAEKFRINFCIFSLNFRSQKEVQFFSFSQLTSWNVDTKGRPLAALGSDEV